MYRWILVLLLLIVRQSVCIDDNETTTSSMSLQTEDDVLPETTETPTTPFMIMNHPKNHQNETGKIQTSQTRNYQNVNVPIVIKGSDHNETPKREKGEFRPSPQLETFYEFNGFPSVQPALSEPKLFGANIKIPILSAEPPQLQETQSKENNDHKEGDYWTHKVRFPQTHPITVNDHPYPYMKESEKMILAKRPIMDKHYSYSGPEYWGSDFGAAKRKPSKTYYEDEHHHHSHDLGISPWKKLIKVLTTFIPIGLLISALTPSIITIGPANGTFGRARMEDKDKPPSILNKLSLQGCDDRIFCELLLSAEENNQSDGSIENMLDNYMQKYGDAAKLKLIYRAIKTGNCSSLHCDTIKT